MDMTATVDGPQFILYFDVLTMFVSTFHREHLKKRTIVSENHTSDF